MRSCSPTTFRKCGRRSAALASGRAVIDGEIVALDKEGRSSFQLLQAHRSGRERPAIFYYAFDLLHLDGRDLLKVPLCDRKALLAGVDRQAETRPCATPPAWT